MRAKRPRAAPSLRSLLITSSLRLLHSYLVAFIARLERNASEARHIRQINQHLQPFPRYQERIKSKELSKRRGKYANCLLHQNDDYEQRFNTYQGSRRGKKPTNVSGVQKICRLKRLKIYQTFFRLFLTRQSRSRSSENMSILSNKNIFNVDQVFG